MLIKQTPLHLLAQAPRHSLFHRHCDLLSGDGQLIKAFATAWKNSDQSTDRDTYINSSITVIDSMQVQPEMIYAEEGQGLTDGEELDHLADLVRADGTWVYYGVPAENFFIVTWMPDAEAAEAKIAALREEGDCVACCVDLAEEWNFS